MLNRLSRRRSDVGRIESEAGPFSARPLSRPPTIRIAQDFPRGRPLPGAPPDPPLGAPLGPPLGLPPPGPALGLPLPPGPLSLPRKPEAGPAPRGRESDAGPRLSLPEKPLLPENPRAPDFGPPGFAGPAPYRFWPRAALIPIARPPLSAPGTAHRTALAPRLRRGAAQAASGPWRRHKARAASAPARLWGLRGGSRRALRGARPWARLSIGPRAAGL